MKNILLFTFLFLASCVSVYSQAVNISGNSKTYAGDTISFYTYTEYITKEKRVLATTVVDSLGNFNFNFKIPETICAYIELEVFEGKIFLEKGQNYRVVFPKKVKKTQREILNPFFVPQRFYIRILNVKPEDLNAKISAFNTLSQSKMATLFVHFSGKVAYSKVENAIKQINDSLPTSENKYFKDYKKYHFALMRYITYNHDIEKVIKSDFLGTPLYYNVGFTAAFDEIIGNYFENSPNSVALIDLLTKQKSWEALNTELIKSGILVNTQMREYVLLKALYATFYKDYSLRNICLSILKESEKKCKTAKNQQIASNIIKKLGALLPGNPAPEIFLKDQHSNAFSLNKMAGKFIYLSFYEKGNYVCQKEISLLAQLNTQKIDLLQIVTIWTGGTEAEMKAMVKANNYNWTFLYAQNTNKVLTDYQVVVKPSYVLIHPEGTLVYLTAPSPAENFEALYFETYKKWKRKLVRKQDENSLENQK